MALKKDEKIYKLLNNTIQFNSKEKYKTIVHYIRSTIIYGNYELKSSE